MKSTSSTKKSLGSALLIMLGSCFIAMLLMIVTSIITGEWLYIVAAVLFLISGITSVLVVRNLQRKIDGPRTTPPPPKDL